MTTDAQKSELLEDFQQYLQQSNIDSPAAVGQPDLHTLLSEITALKTEVKTESRQFKSTLDSLSSALETVQGDNQTLSTELSSKIEKFEQQQQEMMRSMLLDNIDVYSRMITSLDVLQNYKPIKSLFKNSRKKDIRFIKQMTQGQEMMVKRFEKFLHSYQVKQIECVGNLLDPLTMRAVETSHNPQLANGIVIEELQPGFLFKNKVLRLAEVKVNKLGK